MMSGEGASKEAVVVCQFACRPALIRRPRRFTISNLRIRGLGWGQALISCRGSFAGTPTRPLHWHPKPCPLILSSLAISA